ncbi:MAG: hypothetical protein AAF827_00980 [Cyanobacteria bacterium P01_D01_bin.6]
MAGELNVSPSTVSRALKALDAKGWIDLEIMSARVKLHTSNSVEKVLPLRNSVAPVQQTGESAVEKVLSHDNGIAPAQQRRSPRNKDDREATLEGQIPLPVENLEALQGIGSGDSEFSTECTRSVLKHLNKQTGSQANPTMEIDRGETGTFVQAIAAAGIPINAALAATLTQLQQIDPENAAVRVRNALSSLQEQDNIRNPQAFLNAALKRGFTANQAKQRSSIRAATPTQNREQRSNETTVPPVRDLSAVLVQIGLECDRLRLNRDEAVQRLSETYGWTSKRFADLDGDDMEMLLAAMTQWS